MAEKKKEKRKEKEKEMAGKMAATVHEHHHYFGADKGMEPDMDGGKCPTCGRGGGYDPENEAIHSGSQRFEPEMDGGEEDKKEKKDAPKQKKGGENVR